MDDGGALCGLGSHSTRGLKLDSLVRFAASAKAATLGRGGRFVGSRATSTRRAGRLVESNAQILLEGCTLPAKSVLDV